MTKIKTVRKWEEKYNIELKWVNLPGRKVENVQYEVCKEYKTQIMSCKNFSNSWIKVKKNTTTDAVKKHATSEMHKQATDLALKNECGTKRFAGNLHQKIFIGKLITKMNKNARKVFKNRFTIAYCLAKNEKLFADYQELLEELSGLEVEKDTKQIELPSFSLTI